MSDSERNNDGKEIRVSQEQLNTWKYYEKEYTKLSHQHKQLIYENQQLKESLEQIHSENNCLKDLLEQIKIDTNNRIDKLEKYNREQIVDLTRDIFDGMKVEMEGKLEKQFIEINDKIKQASSLDTSKINIVKDAATHESYPSISGRKKKNRNRNQNIIQKKEKSIDSVYGDLSSDMELSSSDYDEDSRVSQKRDSYCNRAPKSRSFFKFR